MSESVIDWTNDKAVVRAAVPGIVDACWPNHNSYELVFPGGLRTAASNEWEAWRGARQHPTVQAFERLHNPSLRTGQAKPEATNPKTVREWLEDAIGRYQVTHIHSSVKEAIKLMGASSPVTPPENSKPEESKITLEDMKSAEKASKSHEDGLRVGAFPEYQRVIRLLAERDKTIAELRAERDEARAIGKQLADAIQGFRQVLTSWQTYRAERSKP